MFILSNVYLGRKTKETLFFQIHVQNPLPVHRVTKCVKPRHLLDQTPLHPISERLTKVGSSRSPFISYLGLGKCPCNVLSAMCFVSAELAVVGQSHSPSSVSLPADSRALSPPARHQKDLGDYPLHDSLASQITFAPSRCGCSEQ